MPKRCGFVVIQHGPTNKYNFLRSASLVVHMGSPLGRIQQLDEAIQAADGLFLRQNLTPDLKIAICPEHYLSKQHGYNPEVTTPDVFHEISGIIPIFQALKQLSDRHPDWLIIPGSITVLGLDRVRGSEVPQRLTATMQPSATNAVSGSALAANQTLASYQQNLVQDLQNRDQEDFRPCYNVSPVYSNGTIVLLKRKMYEAVDERGNTQERIGVGAESTYFPMIRNTGVLTYGGLSIGIEICVEHEHGTLAYEAGNSLDLHIVFSNEVYPFSEHAAIKNDGLFVHAGATTTGTYRSNELPRANESDEFAYANSERPGTYIFVQTAGS